MSQAMKIKVSTEQLMTSSGQVSQAIDQMERAFEDIRQLVDGTSIYWEGDGRESFSQCYHNRQSQIDEAIRRFRENVTDLENIAGNYSQAESENIEQAQGLPMDVII